MSGKILKRFSFRYENQNIEISNEYLGIIFKPSGTFSYATSHLSKYGNDSRKDAYFPSLMDRHTSRLIFCKMIRYTLYYHLSPVVEFSHGAFFCKSS